MIPFEAMPVVFRIRDMFKDVPFIDRSLNSLHMVTFGIGMTIGHLAPKLKDEQLAIIAFRQWISEQTDVTELINQLLGDES